MYTKPWYLSNGDSEKERCEREKEREIKQKKGQTEKVFEL